MVCGLVSITFDSPQLGKQLKQNSYIKLQNIDPKIDFFKKGLRIASLPHFVYDFSRKMFLILYSINWPNFLAWLALLREIFVNMFIAIVC